MVPDVDLRQSDVNRRARAIGGGDGGRLTLFRLLSPRQAVDGWPAL